MTDDDRMDRAKRIREMREGNRDGGDAGDDGSDADNGGDEPADAGNSTDDGGASTNTRDDGGEESIDAADDVGDEPTDASGDSETDNGGPESGQADVGNGDSGTEDDKQTMEDLVTEAAESASEQAAADESVEVEDSTEAGENGETVEADGSDGSDDGTTDDADADDTTEGPPVEDGVDTETGAQDAEQQPTEAGEGEGVTAPLPDTDTLEAALDEADEAATEGDGDDEPTSAPGAAEVADADEATTEEETRVLEFTLDDEHYCLNIEYIEEIVKEETITRVPNTPEYVAGVVDLRGQITTILNPKVTLGKENTEADELIVVFDSEAFEDQGHLGWVVDDVRQVSPIVESEVNDPPMEADYINGVIDRDEDEEFVIWTSPDLALEEAD